MNATVIDTLKFADRLKKSGFEPQQAEGLARAFGDELAERMVTKRDLDDAVRAINTTLMAMDAKFESKFDALEPRFDAQHWGVLQQVRCARALGSTPSTSSWNPCTASSLRLSSATPAEVRLQ